MKYYELRHTVGFAETNLIGNVYYVNHLSWQGRCREMFLHDHAPGVLDEIARGLRLATLRCSCEYDDELRAFDEVVVRMSLGALRQTSLLLRFDYYRVNGSTTRVARGEQEIACLRDGEAVAVPEELREALRPYRQESS
jgi:enediyne biosynthesis thioesterase